MPNRIIKESICVSDSIDSLTWFEEVLFYRLIVNCDDYGRFDGRISVIKNRLFPLKDNLTVKSVKDGINKLASAGLVALYVFEGKPFLYLPTWNDHQNVRAKRSKYPAPDSGVNASEYICNHVQADVPVIQSESVSESESGGKRARAHDLPPDLDVLEKTFLCFWQAYPCQIGIDQARKAWQVLAPNGETIGKIMSSLEAWKKSSQWVDDEGRYVPRAAKWLSEGHWKTTPAPTKSKGVPTGASGQLGEAELANIRRVLGGE